MAVDLVKLYEIGVTEDDHADLLKQIAAAVTESSLAIVEDATETNADRKAWAYNALTNSIGTAQTMLPAVLVKANDANLLDTLPVDATDTQVRNTVDDLVNVYAEIQAGA